MLQVWVRCLKSSGKLLTTKPAFYRQKTNKITNTEVLKWQELDVHEDSVPGKGEQREKGTHRYRAGHC